MSRIAHAASQPGYQEYPAVPALADWIECFWTWSLPAGGSLAHRILPDGSADILFELGSRARPFVSGPLTTGRVVDFAPRERLLGARLRPGGARAVLGVPLASVLDRGVYLSDLWSDAGDVWERVEEADASGKAVGVLAERLLLRAQAAVPVAPLVKAAVARLASAGNGLTVRRLADQLGVSRQHLARVFRSEIGYGPKRLTRILRVRQAVELVVARRTPLSDIALEAGYCDQAHMNADFRELIGMTPRQLASTTPVPFVL